MFNKDKKLEKEIKLLKAANEELRDQVRYWEMRYRQLQVAINSNYGVNIDFPNKEV